MRVLLMSHAYPPITSGVTVVVSKTAHEMHRRGHEVAVVTASETGSPYETIEDGVRVIRVHSLPNPYWPAARVPVTDLDTLEEVIGNVAPDLIHSHESAWLGIQLTRMRRSNQIPLLATCHFIPTFVTRYIGPEWSADAVERVTWRLAVALLNRYDTVVFPTATQRDAFVREGLRAPTRVISNGVDTTRYHPSMGKTHLSWKSNLPEGPKVLAVGRVAKDKHIDVLVRALANMPASEAHLILAGDGPERSHLEELARESHVEHKIHFLGHVPESDLPELYRRCDVYAISSPYEVQSIPTLQALATGLPVVAVNAGSLPELVTDGVNGFLVRPDDPLAMGTALVTILADKKRAAAFSRNSLKAVEPHAEKLTFDSYEGLYEQAAAAALTVVERGAKPEPSTESSTA
ncbi:MAG: glycosyltransferase [Actinomycetia bacterium]|nr:glycosyltransferase [Actinomycetes bacterium]